MEVVGAHSQRWAKSLENFGLLVPSFECTKLQQQDKELRPRRAGLVIDHESFVWGATAILLSLYKEPGGAP